jgi:nucleotide-binding universal stress UspA family protein
MFEHILLAVDGSEYSGKAVKLAAALAKQFGSEVVVVHVHEHDIGKAASYLAELAVEATALVDGVVAELKGMGVNASGDLREARAGHAARAVVDAATAHNSEVVVMGSRGLSDLQGILLGSVAHKVIQLAETPVLVAR